MLENVLLAFTGDRLPLDWVSEVVLRLLSSLGRRGEGDQVSADLELLLETRPVLGEEEAAGGEHVIDARVRRIGALLMEDVEVDAGVIVARRELESVPRCAARVVSGKGRRSPSPVELAENLQRGGWYRDQVVYYFNFFEADLAPAAGVVPTSPIYVTFNANPGDPGGGPASGFVTEPGTAQTHNVPATLPGDPGYSPLWAVHIYDNAAFGTVMNLDTASAAKMLEPNGPTVNCPIVSVK